MASVREDPGFWNVPGWELKKYLASGAYGHTFLAKGEAGIWRVIKVYDLSDDAKDDLKRIYKLSPDAGEKEISEALRQAIAHDAMSQLYESLSHDEKRHVSVPQVVVTGVTSDDGTTCASVNERLETILADEIKAGKYDSYEDSVPLMEGVLEAVSVVHAERMAKPSPALELEAKLGELAPPPEISDFGGLKSWVHNDIKDSNMAVGKEDEVVLFDFGIATTISAREHHDYENIASLLMRAPELEHVGDKPDARSDVWQIGCFIYSLVSRKNPYKGREKGPFEFPPEEKGKKGTQDRIEFEGKRRSIIESEIGDIISHLRAIGVPQTLVGITAKALSINPDDRYQDAGEMLEDFRKKANKIRLEGVAIERGDSYETRKNELVQAYHAFECSSSGEDFVGIMADAKDFWHYFVREWFGEHRGIFVSRNLKYKSSQEYNVLLSKFTAAEREPEKRALKRRAAEMQYDFRSLNPFEPISEEMATSIADDSWRDHIETSETEGTQREFSRLTVAAAKKDGEGTAQLLEFARRCRASSVFRSLCKWTETQEGFYDEIKVDGKDFYGADNKAGSAMSTYMTACKAFGNELEEESQAESIADDLHSMYGHARNQFLFRQSRMRMAVEMIDSGENIKAMMAWAPKNKPAPEPEEIGKFVADLLVEERKHDLKIYVGDPQRDAVVDLTGNSEGLYFPSYGNPFFVIVLGEQEAAERAARKTINYLRGPIPGETDRNQIFKD